VNAKALTSDDGAVGVRFVLFPAMTTSLWRLLAVSFFKTQGPLIAGLGLLLTAISWLVPLDTHAAVSLLAVVRWTVPMVVFVAMFLATLLYALVLGRNMSQLPRVLYARGVFPSSGDGEATLLLLEKSELFGHDAVVSMYHLGEKGFEELAGVGHVLNIQEDGKIQVLIDNVVACHEIFSKLAGNDATVLAKVRVKPSAPYGYMP
jgi:hypothetical protein